MPAATRRGSSALPYTGAEPRAAGRHGAGYQSPPHAPLPGSPSRLRVPAEAMVQAGALTPAQAPPGLPHFQSRLQQGHESFCDQYIRTEITQFSTEGKEG